MKTRWLQWASGLFAVALVSGLLVVTANAHIGASHSPIDTELPDLTSVEVVSDNEVDFCFDDEVTDVSDAADYFLSGYNADTVATGDDAEPDEDRDECILVGFDDDRDVTNFTIGYIADGAAETRAGDESPANAAALEGSTATGGEGLTVAPNLEEFDTSGSDEIDFMFDEQIDCDRAEAGAATTYGYYDEDGALFDGDAITDCDDDDGLVTVEFTDAGDDVDDAVRVFVDENQGDDEVCEPAPVSADPGGCTSIESEGDETDDNPDLTEVERTDDDEWTFTFDDTLDDGTCAEALFHVYAEDGTEFTGTDCSEDDEVVEVGFDTVPDDAADDEFPLAASENDAVDDEDGDPSTIGDGTPGSSAEGEGLTDAPDLETVEETDEDLVSFFFDEPIDDDFAFDESDFSLVFEDGDTAAGDDIDDAEDNVVTVEFDADDVVDAIGGFVEDDAAADFLGELSEPAAAGIGTASTSTSTTSGTTTDGTSPGTPQTRRVGSTVTIKYDSTPPKRAAFKGKVLSRFKRCESGRVVELHRRKTGTVGRDKTNRKGKWKVAYRKARGGFFAEVLRKVYTAANGDTVICKKDTSLD